MLCLISMLMLDLWLKSWPNVRTNGPCLQENDLWQTTKNYTELGAFNSLPHMWQAYRNGVEGLKAWEAMNEQDGNKWRQHGNGTYW